jgi:hypothetical protein
MDCRQAQSLVALMVGQDHADANLEGAVQQHVLQCASCRKFHSELVASQSLLGEARLYSDSRRRLWPQVAERLAELDRRPRFARFNVWVPTVVTAAACLLLVTVATLETQRPQGGILPGMVWQQPASRDLFLSDPEFSMHRGELPTADDLARWRRRGVEMQNPELQTVKNSQW